MGTQTSLQHLAECKDVGNERTSEAVPYRCQRSTSENFHGGKGKKKTLKKQTPQQQHIHIHKPNKTTAFLAPPNQMAHGMEPGKHRLKRLFI